MTMLSITAPTRSPTSWTPAVPPPACDTIGELLETQEHFSFTSPLRGTANKPDPPVWLVCNIKINVSAYCVIAAGVCTRFCRFILDTNEPPSELHGFEIFSKKRKKPVCTVLNDRLCIPPEHPSNFHLGGPNRKNRVEGKRIEKSWIFQIIVH